MWGAQLYMQMLRDVVEEIKQQRQDLEKMEAEIDEKVYSDTKEQQFEKHRIDNLVDDLDTEIT